MKEVFEKLIHELRDSKRKMRIAKNTAENKYQAEREKYLKLLESDRTMLDENISLKHQVMQLKEENKRLKRGEKV